MRLLPFRFPHLINPILLICNLLLANVRAACKGTQTHTLHHTPIHTLSLSHTLSFCDQSYKVYDERGLSTRKESVYTIGATERLKIY